MKDKNYWFSLKSHVYVEFKKNKILLYDTHTGNYIETGGDRTIDLVSQLYEPENLGVILLTDKALQDAGIREFIQKILEKNMGDLTDTKKMPDKPVRLIPVLNLQKDVDKLKKKNRDVIMIAKDVSNYLLELNLYLNDECNTACPHCQKYCKQIHCCTLNNTNQELCVEEIENIFRQILYSSVGKINISGGNIFQYQDLERLKKLFDSFSETIHCYFHYENFKVNILPDSLKLELIVNFPLDEVAFKNAWYSINKKNTTVHFIIEDEEQYAKVDYLADKFFIEKYNVQSFFTGENMDFFSGNIFLDKEDIFTKTLSIREIFRSQKLNSNFFGSLFVLPDGSVKANMNCQSIGNIKTDNLLNLIYKEMLENTAWRKIRDEKPCADCLYQYLCPSPSNYGTAIGKPDLCHIKE